MMNCKYKIKLFPHSGVLIGGFTSSLAADISTAIHPRSNKPFIPATAVKGALRMEFERLLRGLNIQCCDFTSDTSKEEGCGECIGCTLFGGGGKKGKLRFTDFEQHTDTGLTLREGIAINRKTGTVQEKKYFTMRTTIENFKNEEFFEGEIYTVSLLTNEEEKIWEFFLTKFLHSIGISIGRRKSTGFGMFNINVEKEPLTANNKRKAPSISSQKWSFFKVKIEMKEAVRVGTEDLRKYIYATHRFIPGSTIRGAIAFSLLYKGYKENEIKELFMSGEQHIRCGDFFYGTPYPILKVFRANKSNPTNIKNLIYLLFAFHKKVIKGELDDSLFKKVYGNPENPLIPLPAVPDKLGTRQIVKLTLNRRTFSAHPERLITFEVLEGNREGLEFEGFIFMPDELKKELDGLVLYIGGQRSKGYGEGMITEIKSLSSDVYDVDKICKKISEFNGYIKEQCSFLEDDKIYFTIDFISDTLLPEGNSPEELITNWFKSRNIHTLKIEEAATQLNVIYKGGFSELPGSEEPKVLVPVIEKGSVVICSVNKSESGVLYKVLSELVKKGLNDDVKLGITGICFICFEKDILQQVDIRR